MSQIIAVGVGGFLGAVSRYLIGQGIVGLYSKSFPVHTLIINVLGCLFFGYFVNHNLISNSNFPLKEFFLVGILGGFTTFSTFGFEFISLIQKGQQGTAFIYVGLSIIFGGIAIWVGLNIHRIYS